MVLFSKLMTPLGPVLILPTAGPPRRKKRIQEGMELTLKRPIRGLGVANRSGRVLFVEKNWMERTRGSLHLRAGTNLRAPVKVWFSFERRTYHLMIYLTFDLHLEIHELFKILFSSPLFFINNLWQALYPCRNFPKYHKVLTFMADLISVCIH